MGRADAKLVPFLKENLEMKRFINLKYRPGGIIFYIDLPRFDEKRCVDFEPILKAWYKCRGRLDKYIDYSKGKGVLQAALKKSDYLISLPRIGGRLRFRFATSEEVKEKKRLQKEKAKKDLQPLSPSMSCQPCSPSNPPSVTSSGYVSGSDSEAENIQDADVQVHNVVMNGFSINPNNNFDYDLDNFFNDINDLRRREENVLHQNIQPNGMLPLQNNHPDDMLPFQNNQPDGMLHDMFLLQNIQPDGVLPLQNNQPYRMLPLQNIQPDGMLPLQNNQPSDMLLLQSNQPDSMLPLQNNQPDGMLPLQNIQPDGMLLLQNNQPDGMLPLQNMQYDVLKPLEEILQFIRPVAELETAPVSMPGSVKKYWLCIQKVKVNATLLLICESQVIKNENSEIKEGSVVIQNAVFEPGLSYKWEKASQLNDMLVVFLSFNLF